MFGGKPEPMLKASEKLKMFLSLHWRGVVCVLAPLIFIPVLVPFPPRPHQWCGYTLLITASFWVTECIPLAVTSFIPLLVLSLAGVRTTSELCRSYMNDTVLMFLGSIMLAYSVEQSGLHKRLAYFAIRKIGYSHLRLLLAICIVTTFVSMWITNTAASTMMVPINFAILRVFEDNGLIKIYETNADGDRQASDVTTCYFCAATFSATIGGIGTLVGTGTNLSFKGLFQKAYPEAPDYLSFPKFSGFAVPYMILMEACTYIYLAIYYFGFLRPGSETAKKSIISKKGKEAAQKAIAEDVKKIGSFTYWEASVLLLFSGAMVGFFCRSPQIFPGWGDRLAARFERANPKFVQDSALAMFVCSLMYLFPSTLALFRNCKAKYHEDLPKGPITSVLNWTRVNTAMPFSFMFLLGGGFCLSEAADVSGLNDRISEVFSKIGGAHNYITILIIIVVVIFVTNFASNVAVSNVMTPLAMGMAKKLNVNPLWFCIASGYSASYCFMLPVGTPGNLVVQSAAKIPTGKMIVAGTGPTFTCIIISWLSMCFWAPIVWPDLKRMPEWVNVGPAER